MLEINTVLFLAVVIAGAIVQTLTGFAMGLLIMAGAALFSLADIAFSAAVVSFISLVNVIVALRRGYRHVDIRMVQLLLLGLVPAMAIGIALLTWLSVYYYELLRLLLGVVVIVAGISLMLAPRPFAEVSRPGVFVGVGALGGLFAGLYSAAGPALAYLCYRQPLSINIIRFSLLAVFGFSTALRTVMIGVSGQLDREILTVSVLAVPLVIITTLAASMMLPHVPDRVVRVVVFVVLIVAGALLVATSLASFQP